MVQRENRQADILRSAEQHLPRFVNVKAQIAVREHDPLRDSRRARGENERAHHVGVDRCVKIGAIPLGNPPLARTDQFRQLCKTATRHLGGQSLHLFRALGAVYHQRRFADVRNVRKFLGGNLFVNRDNDPNAADDRHIGHHPRVAVYARDDNPLAAESLRQQLRSERVYVLAVFAVGLFSPNAVRLFPERGAIRKLRRACGEHFFQRSVFGNFVIPIVCHTKTTFPV